MTNEDREQFSLLIEAMASAFSADASAGLVLGYWMGLKDLDLPAIEHAIDRALRECKFMPKPVELRALAGEMSNEQRAVLAWDALKKAISQHGAYRAVDFDDPLINATVRNLGGWTALCEKPNEEFDKWTRKDFERVYASMCSSGTSPESCLALPGRCDAENGARGFAVEPPRRVLTGLPEHRNPQLRALSVRQIPQGETMRLVASVSQ